MTAKKGKKRKLSMIIEMFFQPKPQKKKHSGKKNKIILGWYKTQTS